MATIAVEAFVMPVEGNFSLRNMSAISHKFFRHLCQRFSLDITKPQQHLQFTISLCNLKLKTSLRRDVLSVRSFESDCQRSGNRSLLHR